MKFGYLGGFGERMESSKRVEGSRTFKNEPHLLGTTLAYIFETIPPLGVGSMGKLLLPTTSFSGMNISFYASGSILIVLFVI